MEDGLSQSMKLGVSNELGTNHEVYCKSKAAVAKPESRGDQIS